jgi:hypothetical protein
MMRVRTLARCTWIVPALGLPKVRQRQKECDKENCKFPRRRFMELPMSNYRLFTVTALGE